METAQLEERYAICQRRRSVHQLPNGSSRERAWKLIKRTRHILGKTLLWLSFGCCGSVEPGRSGGLDPQLRMPSPQSERLRFFEDLGRAFQYETTEAAVTIFLFLAPDDSIKLRYLKGYLEKRAIPACITYCKCQAGSGLEIFTTKSNMSTGSLCDDTRFQAAGVLDCTTMQVQSRHVGQIIA